MLFPKRYTLRHGVIALCDHAYTVFQLRISFVLFCRRDRSFRADIKFVRRKEDPLSACLKEIRLSFVDLIDQFARGLLIKRGQFYKSVLVTEFRDADRNDGNG